MRQNHLLIYYDIFQVFTLCIRPHTGQGARRTQGRTARLLYAMYETIVTSTREIRSVFNSYILPRVRSGELFELTLAVTQPGARSGQPPGTLSQALLYLDERETVATAHRFLTPDGEIGASGLPDPKAVLFEGQWLVAEEPAAVPDGGS